jgi:branched-chain amino acid transport system ATP-binding protein
VLEASHLSLSFGGLQALRDFNMNLPSQGIRGLIGPNGAGKTTVFNLLTGVYAPSAGKIVFQGKVINGYKPHNIARLGIARTFQNIRLFSGLSVLDNLLAGSANSRLGETFSAVFGWNDSSRRSADVVKKARELLEFVDLIDSQNSEAVSLPYGKQRKLEIARALMTNPKLLLLDEPAAGMNPTEKESLRVLVQKIAAKNVGVFVIEHDMKFVMNLCQKIIVLDHGEIIAQGTPVEVQANPHVIEAYLGVADSDEPSVFVSSLGTDEVPRA